MQNLEKLITYYTKLLTLSDVDRDKYLKTIATEDPALYDQLLQVYRSRDDASKFFDDFEYDVMQSLFDRDLHQPGQNIGPYRLEESLGVGGMAYVFKVSRTDGAFQREAAIKFIKRGVDTDEVIKRFNFERNVLAGLNHENIAQLYDGGITNEGLPYFVMEYVNGPDITDFVIRKNLRIKQRLTLFLQICHAVDFAHKNLVIHRDLKPGNILINEEGKVKLTDFGIAKLLDDRESSDITRPSMRVMTREYASPEQNQGKMINTASDIYQLGLLLYELLTGERAWNSSNERHEFQFNKKMIPAELISIIQTACMEEPNLRYKSVEALQNDINNFLENKPVTARGKNTWYLFRKFVIRHKIAVITSMAVFIILSLGIGKYIYDINEARMIADYKTIQANSISNFYLSTFSRQYPTQANGDTLTVFDMLQDMERYIENQPSQDRIDKIFNFKLYYLLGEIYSGWNKTDLALYQYFKAAEIWEENDNNLINDLYEYEEDNLYTSIAYKYLLSGQTDSALHYYNISINVEGNKNIATELSGIAYAHLLKGNYELADSAYNALEEELQVVNLDAENPVPSALSLSRLGLYYTRYSFNENKNKIDSIFKVSLKIFDQRKVFRSDPSFQIFRKDKVKRSYVKTGDQFKNIYPESYAETLNYYGIYLYNAREYDSALHYFRKAYQANLNYFGENNLRSLDNLNNIAAIQRNTGETMQALQNFRKCWKISQQNKNLPPAQTLNYYQNYASCYFNLGDYRHCLQVMDTLFNLKEKYAPHDVFGITRAKIITGECYYELGRYKKAIEIYDQVVQQYQAAFGNKGETDLQAKTAKIVALAKMNRKKEATALYHQLNEEISTRLGEESSFHLRNHMAMSRALVALGQHEDAEELIAKQLKKDIPPATRYILQTIMAENLYESNRQQKAMELYQTLEMNPIQEINALRALNKLQQLIDQKDS